MEQLIFDIIIDNRGYYLDVCGDTKEKVLFHCHQSK
jgi:hypothetical protein